MNKQFFIGLFVGILTSVCLMLILNNDHQDTPKHINVKDAEVSFHSEEPKEQYKENISEKLPSKKITKQVSKIASNRHSQRSYQTIDCDNNCANDILNKLLSGYILSSEELNLMNYGSHHIAETIKQNPDSMEAFKRYYFQGVNDDMNFSMLSVIAHLPTQSSLDFVDQLNNGSDSDRINAIRLLSMLGDSKEDVSERIETSIQTETHPKVLSTSIKALNTINPESISGTTLNVLSNHLIYSDSPLVKGQAMEILTQLQYYDSNVNEFINSGLNSSATDLQLSSLHSLANLLNTDNKDQIPLNTQQRIHEIANNDSLPADLRIQALSIINNYIQPQS